MKKLASILFIIFSSFTGTAQLLSWAPDFATESTNPFIITMDATKGNKGLNAYSPTNGVYVHIGVITTRSTSSSDWKYSKFTWATATPAANATYTGNGSTTWTWTYTIAGGLRTFFAMSDPTEKIVKIAILFRNASGTLAQRNTDGTDMYIPIYDNDLAVRITNPFTQPTFKPIPEPLTKNVGDVLSVTAKSNTSAILNLYLNGNKFASTAGGTSLTENAIITAGGNQQIIAEAISGGFTKRDTINFFASGSVNIAPLPAGAKDGINYISATSATLVLYAPGKGRINVIGEFPGSNWAEQSQYQMNKTPDGNYWWLTISGLTPGAEYAYQYLVNGTLKIADPYTEKVLDPDNDKYIPATTYPNLKTYPTGLTKGIVSILQPGQTAYNWDVPNFQRPDKRNLVIYELLLRDFVATHDWNTLKDSLNYFKNLGINAIEIMPFNEFEGNLSWGYNPDFYFAPDKYYGPKNTLKSFIDECHKAGIAVLMDIALNHSCGQSPMVQLYWDAVNNRPAPDNPWFNPVAKHAYNVCYDMNHESPATKKFVSNIMDHWLNDYKIDGFRFDLSKGFTQVQTCDNNGGNCNVAGWSAYDSTRVKIWKGYYDSMQLKSPTSYCILEHFADNSEEQVLSNNNMLLWGNSNSSFNQSSMGFTYESDFSGAFANVRNWTNPYLVSYMESHDEERLMYKNINFGNSVPGYNIRDTTTALKRQELVAAFFFAIPGPKMLWQFGELGYDYSINYCSNGTISDGCRTNDKPIRWDYLQQTNRKKLFDVYSKMIKLRSNPLYKDVFVTNITEQNLGGYVKSIILKSQPNKIVVVGNFDVVAQTANITFPSAGTWYDYLNNTTINATGSSQSFDLGPGEYHVYTNVNASLPVTLISFTGKNNGNNNLLNWKSTNEVNLQSYEIEKSVDGKTFNFLASVNANGSGVYAYNDATISNVNIVYYRLKSIDKDGQFKYSNIVIIKMNEDGWDIMATPNPFVSSLDIKMESSRSDKAIFVITDFSGRQLFKKTILVNDGNNLVKVPEAGKLAKGTYILSVTIANQTKRLKVIRGE
ncbi:MAG: alpha-amylase family glycosyl hydrolase [Ginsengibacter sp.]